MRKKEDRLPYLFKNKGEQPRERREIMCARRLCSLCAIVMAALPVTSLAALNQFIGFTNTSTDWPTAFGYTGTPDGAASVAPTQSGSIMTIAEPGSPSVANYYWDGSALPPSIAGPVYYG